MKEAAELKWDYHAEYVDNILDLRPGVLTVMIGTIFKIQKAKPSVMALRDMSTVLQQFDPLELVFDSNLAASRISTDD